MICRMLPLVVLASLAACAMPGRIERQVDEASAHETQTESQVYTDLIRGMLAKGQYYAALAHIEQQRRESGDSDELRYLEAEAHRELGERVPAEALYRSLLSGAYAGAAYHGLGLLYAPADLGQAIGFLRQSEKLQPTDVDTRNDLGYALMMAGRYPEALPELATAAELAPESAKARNNLILLLMLRGDEAGVQRVAAAAGVGGNELSGLRRQAATLRQRIRAGNSGGMAAEGGHR